ncbi:MAG TPA: hypothetical protein VKB12_18810 [Pyrinomonadaceae bacterium]|nr:hypothetical protein [Pyrinomonadaceae bacterium]
MTICELERPAFADSYAVAGRSICVEARDEPAAEAFRRYFEGWHVEKLTRAPTHEASARIVLHTNGEPPRAPHSFEAFEVAGGGVCRTDGRTYFFDLDGSVVRVGSESPALVEVWVGSGREANDAAASARLVFNASMTAMRRCGLYELHAAGAVEPETGAGLLFVGPSGSGKSTAATQLAAAGWQYLSDDTLLLCDAGERVEARALRRVFAVSKPTTATRALAGREELLSAPAPFDPDKMRFEPESIFPSGFRESCVPRHIFFPVLTREPESGTRGLSQAEAMARLIRMCPWAGYDRPSARAHLGVLARLARQAESHELRAGTDLLGDPAHASDFFGARVRGAAR